MNWWKSTGTITFQGFEAAEKLKIVFVKARQEAKEAREQN